MLPFFFFYFLAGGNAARFYDTFWTCNLKSPCFNHFLVGLKFIFEMGLIWIQNTGKCCPFFGKHVDMQLNCLDWGRGTCCPFFLTCFLTCDLKSPGEITLSDHFSGEFEMRFFRWDWSRRQNRGKCCLFLSVFFWYAAQFSWLGQGGNAARFYETLFDMQIWRVQRKCLLFVIFSICNSYSPSLGSCFSKSCSGVQLNFQSRKRTPMQKVPILICSSIFLIGAGGKCCPFLWNTFWHANLKSPEGNASFL